MLSSLATRLGDIVASTIALDSESAGLPPGLSRNASQATSSEADIRAHVAAYGNRERLTPFRTKQIIKKALAEAPPARPEADECCGSACTPCVKDLWKEEVTCWYEARCLDVPDAPAQVDKVAPQTRDLSW